MAGQNKTDIAPPQTEAAVEQDAVQAAPKTIVVGPPKKGTRCIKYVGYDARQYRGQLRGSHRELTLAQLREATGISNPFTNPDLVSVEWTPSNGYLVPIDTFKPEVASRILKDDDFEAVEA